MMDVRATRNAQDYDWALGEVERYFADEPEPGTPDGDRFDVLAVLIEAYEARHHAVPLADPVDVLHYAIGAAWHLPLDRLAQPYDLARTSA